MSGCRDVRHCLPSPILDRLCELEQPIGGRLSSDVANLCTSSDQAAGISETLAKLYRFYSSASFTSLSLLRSRL
jgi:hypothetical protein